MVSDDDPDSSSLSSIDEDTTWSREEGQEPTKLEMSIDDGDPRLDALLASLSDVEAQLSKSNSAFRGLPSSAPEVNGEQQFLGADRARLVQERKDLLHEWNLHRARHNQFIDEVLERQPECVASLHPPPTGKSPIDALPGEMLGEIFWHLARWNIVHADADPLDFSFPGRTLEAVCSRWREVASKATPALWSKIRLNVVDGKHRDLEGEKLVESVIRAVLRRSKTTPLDVIIDIHWRHTEPHPALSLLWTTCGRWRTLYIDDNGTNMGMETSGSRPLSLHLPRLEQANFCLCREDIERAIFGAPSLRHAVVTGLEWHLTDGLKGCPSQVTSVDLDIGHWQEALPLFPCVETIKLHLYDLSYVEGSPVVLPNSCRTLLLEDIDSDEVLAQNLANISAPGLQRLKLFGLDIIDEWQHEDFGIFPINSLKGFLDRSGCRLTCFSLIDMPLKLQDVTTIMKALPMPEPLCTVQTVFKSDIVSHLTIRDKGCNT